MKYNKGFAPIIIFLVVLGVLAVGGITYFAGKNSTLKNETGNNSDYTPTSENQNQKDKVTNTFDNTSTKTLTTDISCESNKIPLIQNDEHVAKENREDLDKDGVKELMVIYEKTVPGWEGMPMPSYRFTLFTCNNNKLVASYKVDSYSSGSFDFLNYESGKSVFLGGYGGWYLLVKNGGNFEKLSPTDQRLQELQKVGVVYHDGYHTQAKIIDNKIEEVVPGFSNNDPLCCPSKPEIKIVYEFKNKDFNVISTSQWKTVTVNARDFKYPGNWLCKYSDGNTSHICENNIINSHTYTFHIYPADGVGNETNDSISFLSIDPTDTQCVNWLKINTFKKENCISKDGGKNYAVYTNSTYTPVVNVFNSFLEINR